MSPIDGHETVRRLVAETEALLLDFDGPICQVFAGIPAPVVADQLRDVLADGGYTELPADIASAVDPFDILFYAAKLGHDEVRYIEAAFRAYEIEAVQSARPTPRSTDLVRAWKATGRPVAVVSNNSAAAVETYLEIHGLRGDVDFVSARTNEDIALLKPSPFLVTVAVNRLAVSPDRCTLVGDSVTDVQASRAAHVSPVGYANKPVKADRLTAAGVDLVLTSWGLMLTALRTS